MRYEIERLGDISGRTEHKTLGDALTQLEKEYPSPKNIEEGVSDIVGVERAKVVLKYLEDTLNISDYMPERQTPDPEDDRILIWEIDDTGKRKVVWHFSGWHWDGNAGDVIEGGLPQGTLPHDSVCLYKLALEN